MVPKCKSCKKKFKKTDDIIVVDGNWNEPVHDECHYNYISNMHMNHIMDFEEFIESLEED